MTCAWTFFADESLASRKMKVIRWEVADRRPGMKRRKEEEEEEKKNKANASTSLKMGLVTAIIAITTLSPLNSARKENRLVSRYSHQPASHLCGDDRRTGHAQSLPFPGCQSCLKTLGDSSTGSRRWHRIFRFWCGKIRQCTCAGV